MNDVHFHQFDHGAIAFTWSHGPCSDPLVVLHGLGDSSIHTYAPRFDATVLRDTPALFIDLPGFGEGRADSSYPATVEAMAEDVASLLLSLGLDGLRIFAHSMGANIALVLARSYPELARKLILAEPLLRPDESVMAAAITRHSEASFLKRGYQLLVRATSLQARRGMAASEAFLPVLQMADPAIMHRAAVSLMESRHPSFLSLIAATAKATTLIVGAKSKMRLDGPTHDQIDVVRIADAGHFMLVEQNNSTACAILKQVN